VLITTFIISDQDQERQLIRAYLKDKLVKEIKKTSEKYLSFKIQDSRLILYNRLIYVANSVKNAILCQYHEKTLVGHQEINKILKRIS
jgi:hypothetical protein